jgi:hypothetical protein
MMFLTRNRCGNESAARIGDLDDVEELLPDVGGDGDGGGVGLEGQGAEHCLARSCASA